MKNYLNVPTILGTSRRTKGQAGEGRWCDGVRGQPQPQPARRNGQLKCREFFNFETISQHAKQWREILSFFVDFANRNRYNLKQFLFVQQ